MDYQRFVPLNKFACLLADRGMLFAAFPTIINFTGLLLVALERKGKLLVAFDKAFFSIIIGFSCLGAIGILEIPTDWLLELILC